MCGAEEKRTLSSSEDEPAHACTNLILTMHTACMDQRSIDRSCMPDECRTGSTVHPWPAVLTVDLANISG